MRRDPAVKKSSARALAPWQLSRAVELLHSGIIDGCSVEMLATACGLSRSHFAHAFKASTGIAPHHWLLLHRIQRARQMMESTTENLSEVAASCGFADQSHLTRAFRSVVGRSPGAWRRERRLGVTAAELGQQSNGATDEVLVLLEADG